MKRVAAFLFLLVAARAAAQTSAAPDAIRLTVDDAVTRGLAASHRLAEATARVDAARAVTDERRAAALPAVTALAGYTRTNHIDPFGLVQPGTNRFLAIYPDIPDNYRTRLDVQWPIFTGGRVDALERAARAETRASADEVQSARADLRLEITRAYWALVTAREAVRVVDAAVARTGAHLQDVRNEFGQGLLPPNDVASAEAQLSHQQMLAVQARSQRDVAEIDLERLVGVPPGTPIEPAVSLDPPVVPEASPDALVAEARQQRRDRAALEARLASAAQRTDAAAAGRLPVVAVGGGFDYARPNPRIFPRESIWATSWDAGVSVNWPLFDGGQTRAQMAEAGAQERAARERLADFDRSLSADVRQRSRELEASGAAVAAAEAGVRSAAEAKRVVTDRFHAGVATSTDVLEAQVALLQAELDRTQAIAAARLAEARLARALGR